jgi:hypothetical protein
MNLLKTLIDSYYYPNLCISKVKFRNRALGRIYSANIDLYYFDKDTSTYYTRVKSNGNVLYYSSRDINAISKIMNSLICKIIREFE